MRRAFKADINLLPSSKAGRRARNRTDRSAFTPADPPANLLMSTLATEHEHSRHKRELVFRLRSPESKESPTVGSLVALRIIWFIYLLLFCSTSSLLFSLTARTCTSGFIWYFTWNLSRGSTRSENKTGSFKSVNCGSLRRVSGRFSSSNWTV